MSDLQNQSDDRAKLQALEAKLAKRRAPKAEKHHSEEHYSQAQLAWRMVIELVAGLLIGFGIGYGLDVVFNTKPLFLVIFIFFGLAAGMNVMLRSAKEVQRKQSEQSDDEGGS